MQTVKRVLRVDRAEISYLRSTIESYDGMAVVRTLDPYEALIEIQISPGCEDLILEVLESLKRVESLNLSETDMSKSFFITTLGCQMNQYDSDILAQALIHKGYFPADHPKRADLILINTCAVRAKPEHKAYSLLGRMSAIKSKRPGTILGIAGCLAQKEGSSLMERFPLLDLVLGPREVGRIKEILAEMEAQGEKVVATDLHHAPPNPMECPGYFKGRVSGYVSIMEGCNNFCSYCVVPYVRGREVSRSPDEILKESEALTRQGVREITLIGQNVNSYKWGRGDQQDFPFLLREIARLEGLLRIRFTTSHPKDLSKKLIQSFGQISNLCPHIHLPFQAGSNKVLRDMQRGYTREDYFELIDRLRAVRPDIAITSDVMVGFPAESRQDFEMTLDLIERVQFDSLFSFKYSDRKGTPAEAMGHKIEENEKASRLTELQNLQRQITLNKNKELEGKDVEVLVEGHSKRGSQLSGRTGTNKIVNFNGHHNMLGKLVKVTINRGLMNSLLGVIQKNHF